MGLPLLAKHVIELQSAPTPVVAIAAAGSFAGQVAAVVQAAPLWLYVLAAIAPWIPIVVLELAWTARHYRWLAVFCVLIVTQSAYLLEQAARVAQVSLLGRDPASASGFFGALGVERVHTLWTSWAVLGVLLLLSRFPRNPWLWLTLSVAAVAALPLGRSQPLDDLGASVLDVAALNLAFAWQLGRTYDAWLARAFPQLPEAVLIEATGRAQELRLRPGERVEHDARHWYIVTHGMGSLVRSGPGGHDILLRVLGPGQVIRDPGTVAADTALELLAVPSGAL